MSRTKKIPLDNESRELIQRQLEAFRQKFGRQPGPDDPIFFDPEADTPEPYPEAKFQQDWSELMDEAARRGAIPPELAYAAKMTGLLVTETNRTKLPRQQVKAWDDAVQEYLDGVSDKIH